MKVLDLDLDYFLDNPVSEQDHSSDERITDIECLDSVWSKKRVIEFLESNLGLSKNKKIKGRILKNHDEALYFWEELINNNKLKVPFSVVHVDSHPDLGFGSINVHFILEELVRWTKEYRKPRCCKNCELDGRFYNIDMGDYLLYGVAFRWFSNIIYCANPKCDMGAIPSVILKSAIPQSVTKPTTYCIQLYPRDSFGITGNETTEPKIPLHIIPAVESIHFCGDFDFVSIAQSPNYTPQEADYILDVFREYIEEI